MTPNASRRLPGPYAIGALLSALAACDAPPSSDEATARLSDTAFFIRALGDRCIDITARSGGALTIQKCNKSINQMFLTDEIDGSHDFRLIPAGSPTECVTVEGPPGQPFAPGQRLVVVPCFATDAQRFAFDGDALMVGGAIYRGGPTGRDFVIEPLESNTNEGTLVVVGTRDLDDAEYWRMIAADGSDARPHSGFVTIETDVDLALWLAVAEWGDVLELDPLDDEDTILLSSFPFKSAVHEGVTLRGGRKFMDNGVLLDVPDDRIEEQDRFLLQVHDYGRVTQLRLEGIPWESDESMMAGLQIGEEVAEPPALDPTHVIVDHVELSHWSIAAIRMWGGFPQPFTVFDCPLDDRRGEADAKLVGNFIHHHESAYGIVVAQGAFAFIRGSLMFRANHHVTSSFYNAFNRYVAFDNLFLDHDDEHRAIFDVHGSCSPTGGHWAGGRAGDYFEAAFNSFLTKRAPLASVRGTPCDHFSFHHNLSVSPETSDTFHVETNATEWCSADGVNPFVPNPPNVILQVQPNNQFEVENPLDRRFGVGDFDGDGRDDVFFGTGVTWWFSSGGKAEWRHLNRMPQRTSELIFGDFDADGRTDVVAMNDDRLEVSWAGASRWFPLNGSLPEMTIEDIAVGQFDSDPRADLFFGDGSKWYWASGGDGGWSQFGISGYRVPKLRFGDFTGDGLTDVFSAANGRWKIAPGVWQPWQDLGPARLPEDIHELVVADFDGDGLADVGANHWAKLGHVSVNQWMMSSRGSESPIAFNIEDQYMVDLPIGRFDDQPGADVLRWQDDLWFWLNSPFANERWSRQFMR